MTITYRSMIPLDIPVIASGGVGNLDHLVDGVLEGHAPFMSTVKAGELTKDTVAASVKDTAKILDLQNPAKKMSKSSSSPAGIIDLLDVDIQGGEQGAFDAHMESLNARVKSTRSPCRAGARPNSTPCAPTAATHLKKAQ